MGKSKSFSYIAKRLWMGRMAMTETGASWTLWNEVGWNSNTEAVG